MRETIPPSELASIIDNIGLPYSSINTAYSNSAPIGTMDADVLVTLKPGHRPIGFLRPRTAPQTAARVSRRRVLLSAGRYHQPDSQFRPARAHRYSSLRPESGRQPRLRHQPARPAPHRSRRGGSARPPALRPSANSGERRPHQGHRERLLAAGRRQQSADLAERKLSNPAVVSGWIPRTASPTAWWRRRRSTT